ncbi:MAG: tripartite tricarboxylate transporter substrate binding protein [Betaproteobacteria bacterium]|nr:tripartite tricarboxylate transporter substrate binding protein [Betaproteobacteria bacterium]
MRFLIRFSIAGWLLAAATLHAQTWPVKPVRIIISNSAGGSPDIIARMVADRLGKAFGQSFVVENRPGGESVIGADLAAKSAPDGYTFYLATGDTHASNLFRLKSIPFDPDRDFIPVANVIDSAPFVVAVHPDLPVRTYPELVSHAKANPGKLSVGITIGISDILARWMNHSAGTDIVRIPYKINPQATQDAVSGQIQVLLISLPSIDSFVRAGKLRVIAVSSSRRFPSLPDTPTVAETYPGLVIEGWLFLVAPTGTPGDIVQRMNREVDRIVRDPEVVQRIRSFGFSASDAMTAASINERVREERGRWKRIAQDLKLQPQ